MGGRFADGHQCRNSGTTNTLSSTNTPGHDKFILALDIPNDWRSTQNDNLWQGVNGINNPCPKGYRLPTDTEWNAERASWGGSNDSAGAITSPLKLPAAGNRNYGYGDLLNVGSNGYYWSSTVYNNIGSKFLEFDSSNAKMENTVRARGLSVRCIKDL